MKIPNYFFVTAVITCQQLITAVKADENENQPGGLKFGTSINFSMYIKITVYFFHINCHQLSTADDN